jgi:enoyl-CoA hydratase
MSDLVAYALEDGVARISMDDGKANAMSADMLSALHVAFDRAVEDDAVVLFSSERPGVFSAGFDLKVFASQDPVRSHEMVRLGAELAVKILELPTPVLAVCEGHAVAMGAFLLLACDRRIAVNGPYLVGFNEVKIGIPTPGYGIELARQRLAPAFLSRTAVLGEMFAPKDALAAGFFDHLVTREVSQPTISEALAAASQIHRGAHAIAKTRVRASATQAMRAAIAAEVTLDVFRRRSATPSAA